MGGYRMYRIPILAFLVWFMTSPVFAGSEKRLFEDHFTYTLTANDSKNDARRYCFMKARDKVVDRVKTFLKDTPRSLGNFRVTGKDVDVFTGVLINVDTKNEKWTFDENRLSVFITAVTDVNADYLMQRISSIKTDDDLKKKILADQNKLKNKEKEYLTIREQLANADADAAMPLRKKKQALSEQMDKLQEIKYLISEKTKNAANLIQPGMTLDELVNIAGQPRGTATCDKPDYLNYGSIWVSVSNGIVTGKIPVEEWAGPCREIGEPDKISPGSGNTPDKEIAKSSEKDKFLIIFKNGKEIPTPAYYTIENVIYYKRFGGIIGVEESEVDEITEIK